MRRFLSAIAVMAHRPQFHQVTKCLTLLKILFFVVLTSSYTQTVCAGETAQMPPDGKLLNRACHSESPYDQGFCYGFIVGVASGGENNHDSSNTSNKPFGFCLEGKNFSLTDLKNIVLSYIVRNRPRVENIDAKNAVVGALEEAYPCH